LDFLCDGGRVEIGQKMIKKAVILARGLGKRMREENESAKLDEKQAEIASQGIKALMPIVGDKTLLEFIFENLFKAGFIEFCLVIGNEHQAIRDFCAKLNYNISFAIQEKPLGTANAVLATESFANNDNFLVVNSDNLYPVKELAELKKLKSAGLIAFDKQNLINKSNIDEDKINKFAVLDFDTEHYLVKIIEKPETTANTAFISMNAWIFSPKIFEACRNIKLSARGEFEIADAVNFAIKNLGEKFKAVYSIEGVLDLSSRVDVEGIQRQLQGQ
jgi:dTDP-glucose pyrophosphorylase